MTGLPLVLVLVGVAVVAAASVTMLVTSPSRPAIAATFVGLALTIAGLVLFLLGFLSLDHRETGAVEVQRASLVG